MNFRFWILDYRRKSMKVISSKRRSDACSDNLKSAIQNPKWVGIFAFALTFAFGGVEASAQQSKRIPRIGYLSVNDAVGAGESEKAIRVALRERGYIEGQNIAIDYRYSAGQSERAPQLAAELVRL
jgi:putative ABC transport system substrate-binding protein